MLDLNAVGMAGRGGRADLSPSVDRIDSRGNYVIGNIHVVAQVVNVMKNDIPVDRFVALCQAVASYEYGKRRAQEDDLLDAIS